MSHLSIPILVLMALCAMKDTEALFGKLFNQPSCPAPSLLLWPRASSPTSPWPSWARRLCGYQAQTGLAFENQEIEMSLIVTGLPVATSLE